MNLDDITKIPTLTHGVLVRLSDVEEAMRQEIKEKEMVQSIKNKLAYKEWSKSNNWISFPEWLSKHRPQPEVKQEPVAWMYPDDLKRFETSETFAQAYSIEMVSPTQGETVPLYTHPQPKAEQGEEHMTIEAYDWDIERCRAYAEQLRDKTRANTAEHAAQAIEWLLAQLASHQIIGKKREWQGLTDEEVVKLKMDGRDLEFVSMTALRRFAKDIEQALKEKNI